MIYTLHIKSTLPTLHGSMGMWDYKDVPQYETTADCVRQWGEKNTPGFMTSGSSSMMSRGGAERDDDDRNAPLIDLLVTLDGARSVCIQRDYSQPGNVEKVLLLAIMYM